MTIFLSNLYLRVLAVRDREDGQTMAEYGVVLAVIARRRRASLPSRAPSATRSTLLPGPLKRTPVTRGGPDSRAPQDRGPASL